GAPARRPAGLRGTARGAALDPGARGGRMNPYELAERDFEAFFAVPLHCYAGTPYVSPMKSDLRRILDPARNPLFRDGHGDFTYFTVRRNGRPVGRIVAHVHYDANRCHGANRGSFGFFDCADDADVARLLLDAAEAWARSRGFTEIVGNFNLTIAQQIGVVTDGFENDPYTDMMYNPPHIPRLLATCGYEPVFPMSTFELDLERLDANPLLGPKQRELRGAPALTRAMLYRGIAALQQAKYRSVGVTWIADVNPASLKQMERLGARRLQRLHLFRKDLGAAP